MTSKSDHLQNKTLAMNTLPVRIIIPVALTIVLFVLTIFLLIIPMIEKNMMADKRESLMQLTDSAWSILSLYHSKVEQGIMYETKAKQEAIEISNICATGRILKIISGSMI